MSTPASFAGKASPTIRGLSPPAEITCPPWHSPCDWWAVPVDVRKLNALTQSHVGHLYALHWLRHTQLQTLKPTIRAAQQAATLEHRGRHDREGAAQRRHD